MVSLRRSVEAIQGILYPVVPRGTSQAAMNDHQAAKIPESPKQFDKVSLHDGGELRDLHTYMENAVLEDAIRN